MGRKKKIAIKILSSEDELFIGEAECLFVPTQRGDIAILPYHIPMLSIISKGVIHIVEDGKKRKITDIEKGVLRVDDNVATVLVNL